MANTDSQIPGEFNYYIISTNDNGDTLWTHTYGGAGTDRCFDMQLISPDQYLIAGTTYDPVTDGDATLTLIQGEGNPVSVNETLPPSSFHLFNAYPNPFNPSTKIKYTIPELKNGMPVNTKLSIYDILGKQVAVLVNKQQTAGEHEVLFDGENLSSGIYFYKLQFGNLIKTKKMILLK